MNRLTALILTLVLLILPAAAFAETTPGGMPGVTIPGDGANPEPNHKFNGQERWPCSDLNKDPNSEPIQGVYLKRHGGEWKGDKNYLDFPDAQPYLDKKAGRVMVPVRVVAEALGAKVDWDGANRAVIITKDGLSVSFVIGSRTYTANGKEMASEVPALLYAGPWYSYYDEKGGFYLGYSGPMRPVPGDWGRTYVPVRFLSEALGLTVNYSAQDSRVYLDEP